MKPRLCIQCGKGKFYNPHAKKQSKASGFVGDSCWDCAKEQARVKHAQPMSFGPTSKEQAYQEHLTSLAKIILIKKSIHDHA